MEIEVKYSVPDEKTMDAIWHDKKLAEIMEEDSRSIEEFDGIYYDTEDMFLKKRRIAFRIRREGRRTVATLKWSGENEGALHKREELNVSLPEDELPECADPQIFAQSEEGEKLVELLKDKYLVPQIEVKVVRRAMRVDTGSSLLELSLDWGDIIAGGDSEPVRECEIELFSGHTRDLTALGEKLAAQYGMKPETRSKYGRGLALLGE